MLNFIFNNLPVIIFALLCSWTCFYSLTHKNVTMDELIKHLESIDQSTDFYKNNKERIEKLLFELRLDNKK